MVIVFGPVPSSAPFLGAVVVGVVVMVDMAE